MLGQLSLQSVSQYFQDTNTMLFAREHAMCSYCNASGLHMVICSVVFLDLSGGRLWGWIAHSRIARHALRPNDSVMQACMSLAKATKFVGCYRRNGDIMSHTSCTSRTVQIPARIKRGVVSLLLHWWR
jgi:hypothetical protein